MGKIVRGAHTFGPFIWGEKRCRATKTAGEIVEALKVLWKKLQLEVGLSREGGYRVKGGMGSGYHDFNGGAAQEQIREGKSKGGGGGSRLALTRNGRLAKAGSRKKLW